MSWQRGAVIYEIYPRSFYDSNGDGVGDLRGVIEKLDYIASLGVDAIWIAPFFKSPMADFGYDVSDYRSVDPLFGSMEDFDHLLGRAHALGLKVMIDQVLSHTSDQHPWFRESRESRNNPKSSWYVWADAKPDGSPPNNWLSIFGGVAWRWEPRRGQYYLHNFLASQPDLNYHEPQVRAAILDSVKFWLDKGVDGLRLDAVNFCFHDAQLRDNPPRPVGERHGVGFRSDNPYAFQYHYYNHTQPRNLEFLEDLRALVDRYPGAAALGEISSEDSLTTMAEYIGERRLHMGYCFELLTSEFSAAHIRATVEKLEAKLNGGWPCWAISNHDVERVLTRWGGSDPAPELATQLIALMGSLRGSMCLYQGEELGLTEADVPYESLRDPYGLAFWPNFKGRDGCRTPMPWTDSMHGGFSTHEPWLPVTLEHRARCVALQALDRRSVLNSVRAFLHWRRRQSVLQRGDIRFLAAPEPVIALVRTLGGEQLCAVFNLARAPIDLALPELASFRQIECPGVAPGELAAGRVRIPAHGAVFGVL